MREGISWAVINSETRSVLFYPQDTMGQHTEQLVFASELSALKACTDAKRWTTANIEVVEVTTTFRSIRQ